MIVDTDGGMQWIAQVGNRLHKNNQNQRFLLTGTGAVVNQGGL